VIFEVNKLNVKAGFAFLDAVPRKSSGGKIDYKKTKYRTRFEDGDLDGGSDAPVLALLKYRSGKWKTLTFVIGPTDVAYDSWWKEYGAPKAIFPNLSPD
jgi:hypothetical protein